MKRLRPLLLGLLATAAVLAAGPAKDSEAPSLTIDPVNVDGDAYDVVADAGGKPCIVFIVREINTKSGQVAHQLERLYREYRSRGLHAAVVLLGSPSLRDRLAAGAKEKGIQVPWAVLPPDSDQLPPWRLEKDTRNLLVFIKGGKVTDCLVDVSMDNSDAIAAAALKILKD